MEFSYRAAEWDHVDSALIDLSEDGRASYLGLVRKLLLGDAGAAWLDWLNDERRAGIRSRYVEQFGEDPATTVGGNTNGWPD
ncbi:MAG: hypothetical protein M3N95_02985 [Actinomycetota bacterium]|nr:hypothetical protein [Actinomycetota bacterium]